MTMMMMMMMMIMISRRKTTTLTWIISIDLTVNYFLKETLLFFIQVVELCLQSGARARYPKVGLETFGRFVGYNML